MGHGHFNPTALEDRVNEIIETRGHHVDVPQDQEHWQHERRRNTIKELFTNKYGFKAQDKWLSKHEKVIAETSHGAQLREIHHPAGTTIYYYIVVVKNNRWNEPDYSGLATQHTETYYQELRQLLIDLYGAIYDKTSAWTSTKVAP